MTTSSHVSALLQRWHKEAAKPSQGTDYDTGQYDAIMVCISELHAALTCGSAEHNSDDAARSYDERQITAPLVTCVICLRSFYATDATDHFVCAGCR